MDIKGTSASSYDLYSFCEWKFFLQQILGFVDIAGAAALMGTISHNVLEILSQASINKHDKNSKIWNIDYLWNICYNHYSQKMPEIMSEIKNDKLNKVCKGIHNLLESDYTPIRDNTIGVEIKFSIPIKEKPFFIKDNEYFKIRGRIDRVDKINDDTIEIIDYKTGTRVDYQSKDRHKNGPSDLHQKIQPQLYYLAAKELYPWAKNFLITFIYLVDGGPITVPFCENDISDIIEKLRRRFKAIESNMEPQQNKGWHCNVLCNYSKNGICDSVWKEKNEVGIEFVQNKYQILNIRRKT